MIPHDFVEANGGVPGDEDQRPFLGILLTILAISSWFYGIYLPNMVHV